MTSDDDLEHLAHKGNRPGKNTPRTQTLTQPASLERCYATVSSPGDALPQNWSLRTHIWTQSQHFSKDRNTDAPRTDQKYRPCVSPLTCFERNHGHPAVPLRRAPPGGPRRALSLPAVQGKSFSKQRHVTGGLRERERERETQFFGEDDTLKTQQLKSATCFPLGAGCCISAVQRISSGFCCRGLSAPQLQRCDCVLQNQSGCLSCTVTYSH